MAPRQRTHSSVADLLSCPTFLQRLSPAERSEIFSTARCSKPPASPAKHGCADRSHAAWMVDRRLEQQTGTDDDPVPSPGKSARVYAAECSQQAPDLSEVPIAGCLQNLPAEVEQLLQDKRLLQEQKQQLQAKITTLQYQVSMLLADNKGKEAQGDERLSALEIVIDQLQVTVADVGAIAARVAAENKVLLAENMQLSAEREQHLSNMLKLKEHRHQIEDKLGTGITAASQQAVGAAPGAATVGAAAMVITPVVAATAMPPNYDASSCSSIITQAHRNPALQEIASLGRARATLQKQVAELQQRLSAAEEKAQAAASTAASERARYGRELAKCQQRLEYSVQRLQVMADRGHQQQVAMQERERYIHKLEQCLLHQHEQLSQKAASAVAKLSNGKVQNTAAHRPATSNRQHVKGLLNSVCSSKRLPSAPQKQQLTAHIEAQDLAPGRAAAGSELDVNTGSQTGAVCAGMRSNHKEVSIPVQRDASAAAAAIPDSHPFATANAAQRTAVAQQCKHAMLSVSPQGRASRQRARIASAAAAEDEAEM